jgi:SRSO17 transposase
MDQRFRVRLEQARQDAEIPPGLLHGLQPRLESFLEPFVASLQSPQQRGHAHDYVRGLLSDLDDKNAESIAYLHDQQRQGLQKFIGQVPWDDLPLRAVLAQQIGTELGQADGVLVFDPSAFAKKGTASVGVQRQWCGRLGKLDNCQVGIYLGYVARCDHALVDFRLFLPREWAGDRRRRRQAGVPRDVRFRTRHELALHMLDQHGTALPHAWIAGDDEMGRSTWFRRQLRQRGESYLLAVPCNTLVRDLAAEPPPWSGRGRRPKVPFARVDRWCAVLPESRWQTVEVRAGEKGPLVVQLTRTLVQARTEGRPEDVPELLVVVREQQGDGTFKHDYLLSNSGAVVASVAELARVFKAEHRIEECLQRAKGEAGLADYQVRTWEGWHHHQTLALLATWFLTQEARRGKNPDRCADGAAGGGVDRGGVEPGLGVSPRGAQAAHGESLAEAERRGAAVPLETSQPLATAAA